MDSRIMGCENSVNIVPNDNLAISGSSSDMVFEVSPTNEKEEKENVGNSKWTYPACTKAPQSPRSNIIPRF